MTFPNARRLRTIAKWLDLDKILLETDSPWLAPQEKRGKRNEPAFLPFIAEKIAKLKGISVDELGEAWSLAWTDLDLETGTVRTTPEKGSNPRMLKLSGKLIAMLNLLPRDPPKPFPGSQRHFARSFRRQRNRTAHKLGNPRILEIHFHTFRHWKATMEYYKTKDILHVQQLLGHKSIQNTMLYTQLITFEDDRFTCRDAETVEDAKALIEAGFEFVTQMSSVQLFRKPK